MSKKAHHSEKSATPEVKTKKSVWRKVITTAALATTLTACDNMKNNDIILNPAEQSAKFKIEYQYSEWSAGGRIVDYDIVVSKNWDTYMGLIKEKDWWRSNKTTVESDNVDEVFDEITRKLDNEQITERTTKKKDHKINYVRNAFKENILDSDIATQTEEIKIKYKPE